MNKLFFVLLFISACAPVNSKESTSELKLELDVDKNYIAAFTLINNSNEIIAIDSSYLQRAYMNIVISYGKGEMISDEIHWPIDSVVNVVELPPKTNYTFKLPLLRGFSKISELDKTECLYFYWSAKIKVLRPNRFHIETGSSILNPMTCREVYDKSVLRIRE
ncbi:MAG: hypothetical protein HWE09_01880 [Cyclobacteriaceae bacterium]|nr:hypothetical protein [Cyclobacteriaceae bacterium]